MPDDAVVTTDAGTPLPSSAAPSTPLTPSGAATTAGGPDLEDCVLSAEAFGTVVGLDAVDVTPYPDYGYPGDKACHYETASRAWNLYLFPADSDQAMYQRRGIVAQYADVVSVPVSGASDAILFNDEASAMFAVEGFVALIESTSDDAQGLGLVLAEAMVTAIGAL